MHAFALEIGFIYKTVTLAAHWTELVGGVVLKLVFISSLDIKLFKAQDADCLLNVLQKMSRNMEAWKYIIYSSATIFTVSAYWLILDQILLYLLPTALYT